MGTLRSKESKAFAKGYSRYKDKIHGRLNDALPDNYRDVSGALEAINENTKTLKKYNAMENENKQLKQQIEASKAEMDQLKKQHQVDLQMQEAIHSLPERQLKVTPSDVKVLFNKHHKIESKKDGLLIKRYDADLHEYKPLLDEAGDYTTLSSGVRRFAGAYT